MLTWCIRVRSFVTFTNDENIFLANVSSLFIQLEEDKNSHSKNNMRVCLGTVLVMALSPNDIHMPKWSFVRSYLAIGDDFCLHKNALPTHLSVIGNFTGHAKKQSYTSQKLNVKTELRGKYEVNNMWANVECAELDRLLKYMFQNELWRKQSQKMGFYANQLFNSTKNNQLIMASMEVVASTHHWWHSLELKMWNEINTSER